MLDCRKTGELICRLRKEKGLTQLQLAERLHVSDKAVSKWERGLGCPDVSLLSALSETLGVNVERLLDGNMDINQEDAGNMNKIKFYVCEDCKSVFTATGAGEISCCGKKLSPLEAKDADDAHRLSIEEVEDEFYVTAAHEMTKEHYIAFIAYVTYDRVNLVKTYPEQDFAVRFPQARGGYYYYYCTGDGLYRMKG